MATPDVLVLGAGVSGLTTAVHLAEGGRSVRVLADKPPLRTTSAVAGASWGPYMVSDPRILGWSKVSRSELERIAQHHPTAGVRLIRGMETDVMAGDPPSWAAEIDDFELCRADELPVGYVVGWRYTIPVVDMGRYLPYLTDRLAACGVLVEIGRVDAFADVATHARTIINCTGLGSRELVPDADLFATRGQLVVVQNTGVDWFFQDNTEGENLTYFLPHGDHVVLGGCALEHAYDIEPDAGTAIEIIKRCGAIEPLLLQAPKLEDRVGLRPTRASVRIEHTDVDGLAVIHNYGHGGAGLTLSWGCAEEVSRLID